MHGFHPEQDRKTKFEIIIPSVMSLIPSRIELKNHSPTSPISENSFNMKSSYPQKSSHIKTLTLHLPSIHNNSHNNSPLKIRKASESPKKNKINLSVDVSYEKHDLGNSYFIPKYYFAKKNDFSRVRESKKMNQVKILNSFHFPHESKQFIK